jgi:hypothetical protein
MSDGNRIADDFRRGITAVTIELYGEDRPENRRKVYREFEKRPEYRLKGIFKTGEREVCCVPSIVRADLLRRASGS